MDSDNPEGSAPTPFAFTRIQSLRDVLEHTRTCGLLERSQASALLQLLDELGPFTAKPETEEVA